MKKSTILKMDAEMQEKYSKLKADVLIQAYERDKGKLAYIFADGKISYLEVW